MSPKKRQSDSTQSSPESLNVSENSEEANADESAMDIDEDSLLDASSSNDGDIESESEITESSKWADAMAKVLSCPTKSTGFILSKAKTDEEIQNKKKKREVEVVDDSGNIIPVKEKTEKSKNYKEQRKEMLEKQAQKANWEAMCRVKPDVTNKDRERELVRIATKGIVHLFNTVEKHQKLMNVSKKNEKQKKLNVVKGNFMDILRECSKKDKKAEDELAAKKKKEETWSVLKDDFMMGAEMKDWDKESDVDT